jgi:hypothetical protein
MEGTLFDLEAYRFKHVLLHTSTAKLQQQRRNSSVSPQPTCYGCSHQVGDAVWSSIIEVWDVNINALEFVRLGSTGNGSTRSLGRAVCQHWVGAGGVLNT